MSKIDRAIKNLAGFIRDVRSNLSDVSAQRTALLPQVMLYEKDYGTLMLDDKEATQYRRILEDLAFAGGERVSREFVDQQARACILHSLDVHGKKGGEFDQRLAETSSELRSRLLALPRRWQVYLRVCGLAAQDLPLTLGRVTFCVPDESTLSSLDQVFAGIVDASPHPEEEKPGVKRLLSDRLTPSLAGQVIAIVEAYAIDASAATELAGVELRRTIDVLNFYSDIVASPGLRCQVYLPSP